MRGGKSQDKDRSVVGLGHVAGPLRQLLDDPEVYEVEVQPDGSIYGLTTRGEIRELEQVFEEGDIGLFLVFAASSRKLRFDESRDYFLACQLPPGPPFEKARLHCMLPASSGGYLLSIRKHPTRTFDLQADYLEKGIITATAMKHLRGVLSEARKNVVVVGSTGAGKTQFVNALAKEMGKLHPLRRYGLVEDVPELVEPTPRSFRLVSTILPPPKDRPRAGQQVVSLSDLIPHCLRLNPDCLVLGELRVKTAAQALLEAWETGHNGGLTTIHGGSALEGIQRLRSLAVGEGQSLEIERRIGDAIGTVVHIRRLPAKPGDTEARFRASVHELEVQGTHFHLEEVA